MKSGKLNMTEGIEQPNQEKKNELKKGKYLIILEAKTIKHVGMKEKKIDFRITRTLL